MRECVQPYYVKDGEILECGSFHMGFINEGKSIYEVAGLEGKGILFLEDHLDRLFSSLRLEGAESWLSRQQVREYLMELIRRNPARVGNVKFVMNLRSPEERHFVAYFVAHRYPVAADYEKGVKVITFPFERTEPNKKMWRPVFRREVEDILKKSGAFEALFLTGTSIHVLPVSRVDHEVFKTQSPVMRTIMQQFENILHKHLN